jgi:hypothetical protein
MNVLMYVCEIEFVSYLFTLFWDKGWDFPVFALHAIPWTTPKLLLLLEAGKRQEERKCMEQIEKINRLCTLFGWGEKK